MKETNGKIFKILISIEIIIKAVFLILILFLLKFCSHLIIFNNIYKEMEINMDLSQNILYKYTLVIFHFSNISQYMGILIIIVFLLIIFIYLKNIINWLYANIIVESICYVVYIYSTIYFMAFLALLEK